MERTDKRGGKPFLDEFAKLVPESKKYKDMFERAVKQAAQQAEIKGEQAGMEKLAFEIVREGIVTEEKAKELIEKTKKHT